MNDIHTRIEDYLDGTLNAAERADFEVALRADPALAEALALAREVRERLARQWAQADAEAALRRTLTDLGKQHFGGGKTISPPPLRAARIRWWMAAAAATVALVVWLSWPPGADALYDRYRIFPEAAFALKSSNTSAAQNLDAAAKLFNTKDFASALSALNAHLSATPDDLEARFFAGLCQLELGQFAASEATFRQIISPENVWSGEARWYLALTYLREKKVEQCKEILGQIPLGDAHHAAAQELLKKL